MEPIYFDQSLLQITLVHYGGKPPPRIGVWKAYLYKRNYDYEEEFQELYIGECNEQRTTRF